MISEKPCGGQARAATGGGVLRLGFGLATLVLGHDVQAVDQARQAAQALRQVLGGAADRGARAEMASASTPRSGAAPAPRY